MIPFSTPQRYEQTLTREWSRWEEKFAWFPSRLEIRNSVTSGIFEYRTDRSYRWIWLKSYWVRERLDFVYKNGSSIEYDYAFDIFDMMSKK